MLHVSRAVLFPDRNDVITWERFPHYFAVGDTGDWSPVESPHNGSVIQNVDVFCFQDLNKRLDCRVVGDLRRKKNPAWHHCFYVLFLQWIGVKNETLYLMFTTPIMYMLFRDLSNLTLFSFNYHDIINIINTQFRYFMRHIGRQKPVGDAYTLFGVQAMGRLLLESFQMNYLPNVHRKQLLWMWMLNKRKHIFRLTICMQVFTFLIICLYTTLLPGFSVCAFSTLPSQT